MEKPTISNDYAVTQAGDTIMQYLKQAKRHIDDTFGKGYAKDHPELVAECVRSQAMDYNCSANTAVMYELVEAIRNIRLVVR